MKKVAIMILCVAIFWPGRSTAQPGLPSYPEVIKEFFTNYSYQREKETDEIYFARKRQGWYVHIVDSNNEVQK